MTMRVINIPMRRILTLPFSTPLNKRLMLLYLTGRRTGRSYRQPVSYVEVGDLLLTPSGGNWKLNLEAGRPERIRLKGPRRDGPTDPRRQRRRDRQCAHDNDGREPENSKLYPHSPPRRWPLRASRTANAVSHGFRIVQWQLEPSTQG